MLACVRTRNWFCLPAAIVAFAACDKAPEVDFSKAETAFVGANVITMEDERILSDQTVLVADGKILAFGNSDHIPVPANAVKIDGKGRYLMPGLAEMHAHIPVPPEGDAESKVVEETLFLYLSNGLTLIRGMLGQPQHLTLK